MSSSKDSRPPFGNQPRGNDQPHSRYRRHDHNAESETNRRIRELDADGEPISLSEQIASENRRGLNGADSQVIPPATANLANQELPNVREMQEMRESDLVATARKEGFEPVANSTKQNLIYAILKQRVKRNGLMYGEGTLEILPDGFGFLRSSDHHYLSCPDDIYVSPSQIRKFALKTGSTVSGQVRPPKENERYFALLRVEAINYRDPSRMSQVAQFDELTPEHPSKRIVMDYSPTEYSTRVVDLVTPIGFGQRGLIVSPPRAGKTIMMQNMAKAVLHNYPDAYVIMLLIDERPEEVTDMEREVKGRNCEVISSTFDEPASRHVAVAQMVIEKAKRLVECGVDVVIFLDSITRLARAWNSECPQSGKILSGGLDANAMQRPKAFFGSARKVEEGGSLTIIATALVDTGSKMDDVIFEEFKGTGNMEIILDRTLVDKRIWPAIDINRSGTRREERLMQPEEYSRVCALRRAISELTPVDSMEFLLKRLAKTKTNAEFLMTMNIQ
jgi:transcription termination factor Rho